MLGDRGLAQRPAPLDGPQRVAAHELVLPGRRRLERGARDHPFREVVEALEALPAADGELAGGEEVLECPLGGLPAPHRLAAPLEGARRQRSLGADAREHLALDRAHLGGARPAPPVVLGQVRHAALEQRVVLDRQQAGLVRPVLEDRALGEQARDRPLVEGADAARERQPVGAVDRRDRVELDGAEVADRVEQLGAPGAAGAAGVALVRHDEAPKRGQRHLLHRDEANHEPGARVA